MTIDDKIRDEILQYDINKKKEKISALSFGNIDKYEYLIGLKTDFSELKDPVAFLDGIKQCQILMEVARYKQKEFNRYLKRIRLEINLKIIGKY